MYSTCQGYKIKYGFEAKYYTLYKTLHIKIFKNNPQHKVGAPIPISNRTGVNIES